MSTKIAVAGLNLSESFRKLVDSVFENIDGSIVEKTEHGYIVYGKHCKDREEVIKTIQETRRNLGNSIR